MHSEETVGDSGTVGAALRRLLNVDFLLGWGHSTDLRLLAPPESWRWRVGHLELFFFFGGGGGGGGTLGHLCNVDFGFGVCGWALRIFTRRGVGGTRSFVECWFWIRSGVDTTDLTFVEWYSDDFQLLAPVGHRFEIAAIGKERGGGTLRIFMRMYLEETGTLRRLLNVDFFGEWGWGGGQSADLKLLAPPESWMWKAGHLVGVGLGLGGTRPFVECWIRRWGWGWALGRFKTGRLLNVILFGERGGGGTLQFWNYWRWWVDASGGHLEYLWWGGLGWGAPSPLWNVDFGSEGVGTSDL